jgi:ornithine cyclodeaminase/alanine dehydrogenase-like protein (mu-crystallin family)
MSSTFAPHSPQGAGRAMSMIGSPEVLARVGPRAAMDAIERAFLALDRGEIGEPVSLGLDLGEGTFHVKACAGMGLLVAKLNANFPGNRERHGLPTIQGVIAVFDAGNGRLLELVDSPSITSVRTAATTALAVRLLAPAGADEATIVGCGVLGRGHVAALRECNGITRMSVFDRDRESARALAAWARGLGVECSVAPDLRESTRASPIVITCTSSSAAYLGADDIRPGTLVAAVGADNAGKAEIGASLLAQARIVADRTAQCRKSGDLRNAPPGAAACGELADAVAGRIARTAPDEIVVFDSTGLAVEDLAVCAILRESR